MDPRLYTYERRKPRLNNPTFKSQLVTDSLLIFKGGPLGSSSLKSQYTNFAYTQQTSRASSLSNHPSDISKIRAYFENNRSKVPLSNLSKYARQIMFPTQKQSHFGSNQSDFVGNKTSNPEILIKPQIYLDNKEKNYMNKIRRMTNENQSKSRMKKTGIINKSSAGKPSFIYNDKDTRYYRYKHSYDDEIAKISAEKVRPQSLHQSFAPSQLNYVGELKGII